MSDRFGYQGKLFGMDVHVYPAFPEDEIWFVQLDWQDPETLERRPKLLGKITGLKDDGSNLKA